MEQKKMTGTNSLSKFAKQVKREEAAEVAKKTNWGKLLKGVYKIIEPELKKLPKIYIAIPVLIIGFELAGIWFLIDLIVNLCNK